MTSGGEVIGVTGASGFVGRRTCALIEARGHAVRRLQRPDFDLLDERGIDPALLAGCSAVIHLAAYIPPNQADPASAEPCWQTNALGVLRLVKAMREAGVTRLIQTSSANAYDPDVKRPTEATALFPAARAPYYLSSKMAQEVFAHHAAKADGMTVTTLRLTSVYGPGQRSGPVAAFARALLDGRPIQLANEGQFGADFVTVDDVAGAILLFADEKLGGIFNIGSGVRSTMAELAETLAEVCDADARLIQYQPAAPGADHGFPAPDISKAEAAGFKPTSLSDGLRQFVAWIGDSGADGGESGQGEAKC